VSPYGSKDLAEDVCRGLHGRYPVIRVYQAAGSN
jgi:hypothetical protein